MFYGGTGSLELDINTAVTGKSHFGKSGKQATVTSVVSGYNEVFTYKFLNTIKTSFNKARVIHVRRNIPYLLQGLGQSCATQTILSLRKVYKEQDAFPRPLYIGRDNLCYVLH